MIRGRVDGSQNSSPVALGLQGSRALELGLSAPEPKYGTWG